MITAQPFLSLAMCSRKRYGLPVAANSVTGLGRPNIVRRSSAQDSIACAFFVPAMSFYGGCAWEGFGPAGFLTSRSTNPRTAVTNSLGRERDSSSTLGADPMPQRIHALNSSSNSLAIAIIGAELIAYRINRLPEQRAHLLGLVQMADTLGALNSTDRATLATTLIEGKAP